MIQGRHQFWPVSIFLTFRACSEDTFPNTNAIFKLSLFQSGAVGCHHGWGPRGSPPSPAPPAGIQRWLNPGWQPANMRQHRWRGWRGRGKGSPQAFWTRYVTSCITSSLSLLSPSPSSLWSSSLSSLSSGVGPVFIGGRDTDKEGTQVKIIPFCKKIAAKATFFKKWRRKKYSGQLNCKKR